MINLPFFFQGGLDWIQVEITTHCNAACVYCPRTVYKDSWSNRFLPWDAFLKIEPAFFATKYLHLQGWGEPLLHPDFFDMATLAKKRGLKTGTTTNGMLLEGEMVQRVVDAGLEVIAFSLAGLEEKSNDAIRKGTRFSKVMKAVESLGREKARRGMDTPAVHIAYMVLSSGLAELENLPRIFSNVGVSQVVLSTLDFVPSDALRSQAIRPSSLEAYQETEAYFRTLVREGEKKGLTIHYFLPPWEKKGSHCSENVQRAFCIASDGAITPCVYTNFQVRDTFYYPGLQKQPLPRLVFGNIQERSPLAVWRSRAYRRFRKSFARNAPPSFCLNCPKLG